MHPQTHHTARVNKNIFFNCILNERLLNTTRMFTLYFDEFFYEDVNDDKYNITLNYCYYCVIENPLLVFAGMSTCKLDGSYSIHTYMYSIQCLIPQCDKSKGTHYYGCFPSPSCPSDL